MGHPPQPLLGHLGTVAAVGGEGRGKGVDGRGGNVLLSMEGKRGRRENYLLERLKKKSLMLLLWCSLLTPVW